PDALHWRRHVCGSSGRGKPHSSNSGNDCATCLVPAVTGCDRLPPQHSRVTGRVADTLGARKSSTVVHPSSGQLIQSRHVQPTVSDAGGDKDSVRADLATAGQAHQACRTPCLETASVLNRNDFGAEPTGLRRRAARTVLSTG